MHICIDMHVCIHMHMCIHMYVYIYIHICQPVIMYISFPILTSTFGVRYRDTVYCYPKVKKRTLVNLVALWETFPSQKNSKVQRVACMITRRCQAWTSLETGSWSAFRSSMGWVVSVLHCELYILKTWDDDPNWQTRSWELKQQQKTMWRATKGRLRKPPGPRVTF